MATPPLALRPAKRRTILSQPTPASPLLEPDPVTRAPIIRTTRPDTPHVRAPRLLDFGGELLTGVILIAGGVFAYGYLPVA